MIPPQNIPEDQVLMAMACIRDNTFSVDETRLRPAALAALAVMHDEDNIDRMVRQIMALLPGYDKVSARYAARSIVTNIMG